MAYVTAENIKDLVTGTLMHLGRPRFYQIAQNWQRYEVLPNWFKRLKTRVDSGVGIRRTLMIKLPNAARFVSMYEPVNVNIEDLLAVIKVPWCHINTNYGYEVREELMNRSESQIVDIIKARRAGALINLAEVMERAAWSVPSMDRPKEPWGLPYWVTINSQLGFNGGTSPGFTDVAGLDPNKYPNYRNYTGTYAAVSMADLVTKMRTAHRMINWQSPVTEADLRSETASDYRIYVDNATYGEFENVAQSLGNDIGWATAKDVAYVGGVTLSFFKHPIVYVPFLDTNAAAKHPVYMVDHSSFEPVVLKGDYLRETGPITPFNAPSTMHMHIETTFNYLCTNRRTNAVFYQASA